MIICVGWIYCAKLEPPGKEIKEEKMPKSQTRTIECPYCHRKMEVGISETKVPKHANKQLPSAPCPGSGYPITKEK